MADLHRALDATLEVHRGVSRRVRLRFFRKAAGGDTVLGRPTAALSAGTEVVYTGYDTLTCSITSSSTGARVDIPCTWETTNPGVAILSLQSRVVEALFTIDSGPYVWGLKGAASTIDEIPVAGGKIQLVDLGLRLESVPVSVST